LKARYSLTVLKVPLNPSQSINQNIQSAVFSLTLSTKLVP